MTAPVIVWFRDDLRLADHPALMAAVRSGAPVLAVYVLDETLKKTPGAACLWWLHHSLGQLATAIRQRGGTLILRRGKSRDVLRTLASDVQAQAIYWNRSHEPEERRREAEVAAEMADIGIEVFRQTTNLLFEPGSVRTKTGGQYSVFTPFYRACLNLPAPSTPVTAPDRITAPQEQPDSDRLEDWGLLPTKPDWSAGLVDSWTPGEDGALQALESFLDGTVRHYREGRDVPGKSYTSRLSPHLHFGELSSRQVWHVTRFHIERDEGGAISVNGEAFLRELVWREFSCHLLSRTPTLPTEPLKPEFGDFAWSENYADNLKAWQSGQTGYPIVDAGMRELWTTGWMHNRVRMIVASFLIKHLLIPWQEGEKWFWDTLVDADLANNSASWQWVAGCGADAAPFFRIFNPILQGEKFDGDGAYVRKWVPEVADLPDKYLHKPWEAPDDLLTDVRKKSGRNYPAPIVDHKTAREKALQAFKDLKNTEA